MGSKSRYSIKAVDLMQAMYGKGYWLLQYPTMYTGIRKLLNNTCQGRYGITTKNGFGVANQIVFKEQHDYNLIKLMYNV